MARGRGLMLERAFEQSHMHEDVRAGAYEMLVPVRRAGMRKGRDRSREDRTTLQEAKGA